MVGTVIRMADKDVPVATKDRILDAAESLGAGTITFPAISCGIYGYPLDEGSRIGLATVREHLATAGSIGEATFVLFSDETLQVFETELASQSSW